MISLAATLALMFGASALWDDATVNAQFRLFGASIPHTTEEALARYKLATLHVQYAETWLTVTVNFSWLTSARRRQYAWSLLHDIKTECDALDGERPWQTRRPIEWKMWAMREWRRIEQQWHGIPGESPE